MILIVRPDVRDISYQVMWDDMWCVKWSVAWVLENRLDLRVSHVRHHRSCVILSPHHTIFMVHQVKSCENVIRYSSVDWVLQIYWIRSYHMIFVRSNIVSLGTSFDIQYTSIITPFVAVLDNVYYTSWKILRSSTSYMYIQIHDTDTHLIREVQQFNK